MSFSNCSMMTERLVLPFYVKLAFIGICLLMLFFVLYIGKDIVVPLLYATVFAILLNPAVNRLQRLGLNRTLSIFLVLLLAFLLVAMLIYFLSAQMAMFSETLPQFKVRFTQLFSDALTWVSQTFNIKTAQIDAGIQQMRDEGLSNSTSMIGRTLSTVGGVFVVVFLLPVYIFMILFYKPLLLNFISQLFPGERHGTVVEVLGETKVLIQSYLVGLLLEASIVATLNSTALLILGIQYAILLGIVGALLNVIPYIGGIIAIALPMLVALATKEPLYALWVFLAYTIVQLLDNNLIVPRVVASKVKINALVSIVVVLLGGTLWGVAGMFLAIPLTAIVKVILDRIEPLKPFGFLLGDNMPPIGKNVFQFRKPKKRIIKD